MKTGLIPFLLLTITTPLLALPVTIGELVLSGAEHPSGGALTGEFCREVTRLDSEGQLMLKPLDKPVKSILEAEKVCREQGIELLLYGWISAGERWWDGELKLYSSGEKRVIREIHGRAGLDETASLIPELARKTVTLLYHDLGEDYPVQPMPPVHNGALSLSAGGGFWTGIGSWDPVINGYGALWGSVRVTCPNRGTAPPFRRQLDLRLGITWSWASGTTRPGWKPAVIDETRFRIPVELGFDAGRGIRLYVTAAPLIQIVRTTPGDIRAAFGGSLAPGCEIALGARKSFSVGYQLPFEITFFQTTQMIFIPVIYLSYALPFTHPKQGERP